MSDIKVLSFDLDGTLLTSKKKIDEKTINWINENEDKFEFYIFASGRKIDQILPYVNIFSDKVQQKTYVISSGGEYIYAPNGTKMWSAESIEAGEAAQICRVIKTYYPKKACIIVTENCDYAVHDRLNVSSKLKNVYHIIRGIHNFKNIDVKNAEMLTESIEKIIVHQITQEDVKAILNDRTEYSISLIEKKQIDIRLKNVNKSYAIRYILVQNDCLTENVMAFGDDENDIDVFEVFSETVAMGNASDSLKRKAKYITDDNDNQGVFKFLSDYFEGELQWRRREFY